MEQNQTRKPKKLRALVTSNLVLTAVALVLALALGVTLLVNRGISRKADQYQQMASEQKEEKEQQVLEVLAQLEQEEAEKMELEAFLEHFHETANRYAPGTEFMQRLFPDHLVYRHQGEYVIEELDDSFPRSDYDWEGFEKTDGEITYTAPDGTVAMKGVDVSKYQGYIDWNRVAADGVEFAMIRAGYRGYGTGDLVEDEYFRSNLQGAINAGLKVGVYFFSQATTPEEGIEEADFVLERIAGYDVDFPIVIDTEATAEGGRTDDLTPAERSAACKAFYDRVEEKGYRSLIYTSVTWLMTSLDPAMVKDCDKWIAAYWSAPLYPYQFSMWQYTATGRVAGISGDVDLNIGFFDYSKENP